MTETLHLSLFEIPITFHCESALTRDLLMHMYGEFRVPDHASAARLVYTMGGGENGADFYARRGEQFNFVSPRDYRFMYYVEKELTIQSELIRSDLYFLHSSALDFGPGVVLLSGHSGNGKSTTCWAMVNNGFGYLSDELAPVDLNTMQVHPFPHSLCLKKHPPEGYELPDTHLDVRATLHVRTGDMPRVINKPRPLLGALFVKYHPELDKPELTVMSTAAAATNLFTHALNPLAHPNDGLAAAAQIVGSIACAELKTARLDDTCDLIWEYLRAEIPGEF
jgi:hypothetical protein